MTIWTGARDLLNRAVVETLGELVMLARAGETSVQVKAQLIQPEARARLGSADYVFADAMAVVREADAPSWLLLRGTTVTTEDARVFSVTQAESNGEGMVEATLSRVS